MNSAGKCLTSKIGRDLETEQNSTILVSSIQKHVETLSGLSKPKCSSGSWSFYHRKKDPLQEGERTKLDEDTIQILWISGVLLIILSSLLSSLHEIS